MSVSSPAIMPRVSCDSLVALPSATARGTVLYAKNSDRPARECQPLAQFPAARYPNDATVRCQYIEIPQVERTLRVLGSRPFWLWGLEHGVNEAGVAAGNHTVFTRDKPEGHKLIGMDLVRLALERGATARLAADVICELVERYGQGGSGHRDADFPYHSSFVVADRAEAFLIETSDRNWALRRVDAVGSATNHVTIGTDWDALSGDAVAHAQDAGWSTAGADRFDFAAAYRDMSWVPPTFSSGRYRRTCEILAETRGEITEATLRRALRDHYDGPVHLGLYPPEDERYLSLCMHADPIGSTTAGAVVEIPTAERPIRFAACLGAPCVGVFIPLYVAGDLPAALARGGLDDSPDSPWWGFRRLLDAVEQDPQRLAQLVRLEWARDEEQMMEAATALEERIATSGQSGESQLSEFMARCTSTVLDRLDQISAIVRA